MVLQWTLMQVYFNEISDTIDFISKERLVTYENKDQ